MGEALIPIIIGLMAAGWVGFAVALHVDARTQKARRARRKAQPIRNGKPGDRPSVCL